jgi:predicted ATPase
VKWKNLRNPFVHPSEEKERRETADLSGTMDGIGVEIANLFPLAMTGRGDKTKGDRNTAVPNEIAWAYRMLNEVFAGILNSYAYIGPLREEPSRRYIYEDEIVEIGIKGENAAYIYLSEQDRQLGDHHFCSGEDKSPFSVRKRPRLASAVNEWLDLMDIHELKPEAANEIIYLNLNASASGRTRVNIADVGFGVSQIFPIVVEGLRMARGHTLLLEQPEIHLHPNLQMQMADYFICLALSGKRVIVETHSDHIVNRLVRRIVEDETDDLNALVGMYFVRATSEGAIVEEVRIDPNEGIVNWPRDFFDQTAAEQERLIQAGVRRRGQRGRGRRHE